MKYLDNARDVVIGMLVGARMGGVQLAEAASYIEDSIEDQDRGRGGSSTKEKAKGDTWHSMEAAALAELELALEDTSWRDLAGPLGIFQFTRLAITKMISLSRVMYLVNPLIHRAVTVQELYVWGSGCEIKAREPVVQQVLDDFYTDPKNQSVIGEAWQEREREQRIDGNTFFIVFTNRKNGFSRIRVLPTEYVSDIICNPDDAKEPWYYKRSVSLYAGNPSGLAPVKQDRDSFIYFPDIDYNPVIKPTQSPDGTPIRWDAKILHVKTGGFSTFKFGIPEMFSALNWGTAYKKILENFATVIQAYARWSMKITGAAGKAGVAAAKSKLGTTINGLSNVIDKNPPTNTGSIPIFAGNMDIQPIKTSHSTTGPDEARALRSMVAAGTDTPEHFFGDSDMGNLATSKTLDRPTELKMISRQTMWKNVILHLNRHLITMSVMSPYGRMREAGWSYKQSRDPFDGTLLITINDPEGKDRATEVRFPPILQQDTVDKVRAVVQAATLGGSKAEGIIPDRKFLAELILSALGVEHPERVAETLYPKAVLQGFADPEVDQDIAAEKAEAALITAKASQTVADKPAPAPKPAKESIVNVHPANVTVTPAPITMEGSTVHAEINPKLLQEAVEAAAATQMGKLDGVVKESVAGIKAATSDSIKVMESEKVAAQSTLTKLSESIVVEFSKISAATVQRVQEMEGRVSELLTKASRKKKVSKKIIRTDGRITGVTETEEDQ